MCVFLTKGVILVRKTNFKYHSAGTFLLPSTNNLDDYFNEMVFISFTTCNEIGGQTALIKVRKMAKFRNRYNQAPHLTQDTNGKVTTSQLDITNESQEVSPFPAGDKNASTNRRA